MNYRVGIGGNLYVWSKNDCEIIALCDKIGKARSSMYWNRKFKVWTIRIKNKKQKVKTLFLVKGYKALSPQWG